MLSEIVETVKAYDVGTVKAIATAVKLDH